MCPRCKGGHYLQECPQVKVIEFQEDGHTIRRVEFFETVACREAAVAGGPKISVSGAISTCPQCQGTGQQPWYLPLATEPHTWQTCNACNGSGFVVSVPPTTVASAAELTIEPTEGGDVRLR